MKANELMTGDWVHVNPISHRVEPHNSQIGALSRQQNDTICIEGFYNGHFGWSVGEEDIEPIPLTEEILKANGWKLLEEHNNCTREYYLPIEYRKGVQWCHIKVVDVFKNGVGIDMEASDYSLFRSNISFKYSNCECSVHELQHALRLCGLNDLADNFKIE